MGRQRALQGESLKKPNRYSIKLTINGQKISSVLIGRHYLVKHGKYMNDELILRLVTTLDGGQFPVDSTTKNIDYYAADILVEETQKTIS